MVFRTKPVFFFIIVMLLAACAPRQAAVIEERNVLTERQQDEGIGGQFIRIVQPGDTLYSIAFLTGLDVNRIAAWNGIADTSKLISGQRIRLTQPIGFTYKRKTAPVMSSKTKKRQSAPSKRITSKEKSTQQPRGGAASGANKPNRSNSIPRAVRTSGSGSSSVVWLWPLRGTIVNRFKPSGGVKGINIQGQRGQGIKASADGEVVYAGNSLKGYGHLVILKHSDVYWSAYANNEKILIAEGQQVKQGQLIANLGRNNSGKAVAQFQIRKNGTPVDPMQYLK